MASNTIQLVECPRDAMQGWIYFIPTEKKIEYLNSLLQVGFHTLDFGSFVSPKAIPQLGDTKEVIPKLRLENTATKLLAIVANLRGAEEAVLYDEITYLGFPFSISETFQLRNTNSTIAESVQRLETIQALCLKHHKILVVYLSMGFGNPYGDPYNQEVLLYWANEMAKRNITIISLADTVGLATPAQISFALTSLIPKYSDITFGVHLHVYKDDLDDKLYAAKKAGCTRFDGAINGIGGCPMAGDELIGNMPMEYMVDYFQKLQLLQPVNEEMLWKSRQLAWEIFSHEIDNNLEEENY